MKIIGQIRVGSKVKFKDDPLLIAYFLGKKCNKKNIFGKNKKLEKFINIFQGSTYKTFIVTNIKGDSIKIEGCSLYLYSNLFDVIIINRDENIT
jgi:hypothetical protein